MIRKPAVAGQFYPGSPGALEREVSGYIDTKAEKKKALGCISPHAGYIYSGPVAGAVLSCIEQASTYIILGPNHSGLGKRFGMDTSDSWHTPLGDVKIDKELANTILENSKNIEKDRDCHAYEHSLEVQLPFLQYLYKDFSIVPIVISYASARVYRDIGGEIASSIKQRSKEKISIIASSDMTHYESQESAKKKDKIAIDSILKLDIDGFLEAVARYDISMCGVAPAAIMMAACIELGAKKAELIKYQTSGDTSGDYSTVVGYAGIIVS